MKYGTKAFEKAASKWARGYALDMASCCDFSELEGLSIDELRKELEEVPDFFTEEDFDAFLDDLDLADGAEGDMNVIEYFWGPVIDAAISTLHAEINK